MIRAKLIYRALFLGTMLVAGGMTVYIAAQYRLSDESTTPDWVSEMPVSMNGQTSELLRSNWENRYWHDLFRGKLRLPKWKAADFFDDPLVVDLCEAISAKDVTTMEQLIATGADVNEVGEDGMTPLYWAFHVDDDPRPFECLLRSGANPNVIVRLDRERGLQTMDIGYAVVHLVSQGIYNRQFKNVFEHGGDPNLKNDIPFSGLPAFRMLSPDAPDAVERLRLLIRRGADVNERYKNGMTHASAFAVRGEELRCRLVLVDLEEGANYRLYYSRDGCYFRLIHFLAEAEPKVKERPVEEQMNYRAVVAWLENHGESLAEAKADLKRWAEWKKDGELGWIEKEHRNRLAREAEKKKSNEKE